jgi:hypothetical protein
MKGLEHRKRSRSGALRYKKNKTGKQKRQIKKKGGGSALM